jgi:glucuronate isomerase
MSSPEIIPSLRMNAGDEISVDDLERFAAAGCRVVDISVDDASQLSIHYARLSTVASFAAAHGWTMLLHLGALRSTSERLCIAAGPAGGFAGMRAPVDPAAVASFLNELERTPNTFSRKERKEDSARSTCSTRLNTSLPRTILLSLNPEAHAQLAVLSGSFVEEGMSGKVQLGPAWWWCDHEEGIRDVLEKNVAYGVLSTFIGMTTDSRSLLSFVRHDYFRRLLCKWIAEKIAAGDFPDDADLIKSLVSNVCYSNAKRIFS